MNAIVSGFFDGQNRRLERKGPEELLMRQKLCLLELIIIMIVPMTSFEAPVDILRLFVELATELAELFLQGQINSYQILRLNYCSQSFCIAISLLSLSCHFIRNYSSPTLKSLI